MRRRNRLGSVLYWLLCFAAAPALASPDTAPPTPGLQQPVADAAAPTLQAQPALPAVGVPVPDYDTQDFDTRPTVLDYQPNTQIPPGYTLQRYTQRGYIISGSITFGVGYGLGFLAATSNTRDKDFNSNWLFLPLLGPFIGLTTQRQTCDRTAPTDCGRNDGTIVALLALGSLQIVGASLFTYGLTHPKLHLVRQPTPQWAVSPTALGRNGYGLVATGVF